MRTGNEPLDPERLQPPHRAIVPGRPRFLALAALAIATASLGLMASVRSESLAAAAARDAIVLEPVASLGPGASKENSGIVRGRAYPDVFWTHNDSGDEPRVYPVRIDGSVVPAQRYPDTPGVLIAGATNNDWEDITIDASGRLIVADFGNNSNARADLTLYVVPEPEPTEGRTAPLSKITFRYPDQRSRPAPRDDFNFDAEAIFCVGDGIFILTKHRSDTFTKLYRVDGRDPNEVNVVTYIDRFNLQGQATAADASDDGLRLAILTYFDVWLFERRSIDEPFFAGRISRRAYRYPDGDSDSEAVCFENSENLLIADEGRGQLFRLPIAQLKEIRPHSAERPPTTGDSASAVAPDLRVLSLNLRYGSASDGPHSWPHREPEVASFLRRARPDIAGFQEAEALQADWLQASFPEHGFHGVGRTDGQRRGEFVPILFHRDRFQLLSSGHFWLSPTPDVPGSKGWDAALERMASWVRLVDRRSERPLLVLNTHLDHMGVEARRQSLNLILRRAGSLADGAGVIILGDFNMPADSPDALAALRPADRSASDSSQPAFVVRDTFRSLFPVSDSDEATFSAWTGVIHGPRIDWILASDELATIDASIDRPMPRGKPISDHYPVSAVLRWR
ncbi:MAG: endonuclease/exonuclease/phosphatase family protein [Planctomycetota bacterium]|nr:endonuclease/exonuclease/phosphatase family protein [Planctomycetota bacterium]